MTQESFARAKTIFLDALERPEAERNAFVSSSCAGDTELEREVATLLESESHSPGFLHGLLPSAIRDASTHGEDGVTPGTRVGPWTIVREIGHGGMGTVYLAERADKEYRGRVALKVVRRGMDTDFILQRFRSERQILASLSHPNIGRLLDGGTTADGRPYFAMEYIEGEDLIAWCRLRRVGLSQRVALFRTVCTAVQYAHRNLVVHRDIKPSNILVTPEGVPHLLDFGLAKVLDARESDDASYLTIAGMSAFTPEYASPEQVRLQPITTASDIFSLGVVLYELLTDVHPFRRKDRTPADIARAVCETEVELPSRAVLEAEGDPGSRKARLLAGDLDTIVLMALRKEPERRYASAEKLSEDLERHFEGRPVFARKDTLPYRTGKFVRRHRLGVAAASLVAASLVAGSGVALWQARVARRSEALAQKRFNDVRKLANSYLFELHDAIRDLPGATPARALLLKRALEYLDALSTEPGDDRGLLRELAEAYVRVGDVQGSPYASNLGDTAGARKSYEKAVAILERLAGSSRSGEADRLALSGAYLTYGGLLTAVGDASAGAELAGKAVTIRKALLAARPDDRQRAVDLAFACQVRGFSLNATSRFTEATAVLREQTAILERLLAWTPGDAALRRSLALNALLLAASLRRNGDPSEVQKEYEKAIALQAALVHDNPNVLRYKRELAITTNDLAGLLSERTDKRIALDRYRSALALREELTAADPADREALLSLAITHEDLGSVLVETGRRAEGLDHLRTARRMLESLLERDPSNARTARRLAALYQELGNIAGGKGNADAVAGAEACRLYRRSAETYQALNERRALSGPAVGGYAAVRRALGSCPVGTP
jgi:eukaryotic-like serine/threonine-protein kinase